MNILTGHKITTIGKKDEISLVLQKGKKFKFKYGLIFLYNVNRSSEKKAAVLIKKSIGNAVRRNYIKRIVRSFFRKYYRLLDKFNRVIILINQKADITYQQLEKELMVVLKKDEESFINHN